MRMLALVVLRPLIAVAALAAVLVTDPFGTGRPAGDYLAAFKPTEWVPKVVKALK